MDNGLRWNTDGIHRIPEWTREPEIATVAQIAYQALQLTEEEIKLSRTRYLTEGAFNKIYVIECSETNYIMRISLPVDPKQKTLSEVATLEAVALGTKIPVPHVIAYDASSSNAIGFEWILMQYMQGTPLEEMWDKLDWPSKTGLISELTKWMVQLFSMRFNKLGALYVGTDGNMLTPLNTWHCATVGPLVPHRFFQSDISPRQDGFGPFQTSRQWLLASARQLQETSNMILECKDDSGSIDSSDEDDAQRTLELTRCLENEIDKFFPEKDEEELFALHHDDISLNNILVNDKGELTALLDWEFSATMPLYKTAYYPSFLVGPESVASDPPQKKDFFHDEDGIVDELYWIRLREYEFTHLRPIFLRAIRDHSPQWIQIFEDPIFRKQHDFELALQICDDGFSFRRVTDWLYKSQTNGVYRSLHDTIYKSPDEEAHEAESTSNDL